MLNRRIAITGVGMVTPVGMDLNKIENAFRTGKNNFHSPTRFSSKPFSCQICSEIPEFNPDEFVKDPKSVRLMNQDSIYAVIAARLAVLHSGVQVGKDYQPKEVALYGSTGLAGITLDEVFPLIRHSIGSDGSFDPKAFGKNALRKVRPTLSFKILSNMPICFVSINEGIMGENSVYNPWEGNGVQAILAGCRAISSGIAECALVGGCDVKAHELGFISLQQQGIFDSWKKGNRGCIPGEGSGFLVLEDEENAIKRNARILAVIENIASAPIDDLNRIEILEKRIEKLFESDSTTERQTYSLISSIDGNPQQQEFEERLLMKLQIEPIEKIFPKLSLGNLFAASGAIQVGTGALVLAEQKQDCQKMLVFCLGHGQEQAAFVLGKPRQISTDRHESEVSTFQNSGNTSPLATPDRSFVLDTPVSKTTSQITNFTFSAPEKRRVVITGKGIVSPIGNSAAEYWQNAIRGVSGVTSISLFDASTFPVRIGGEVKNFDFDKIRKHFPETTFERDRKVYFGLSAAHEALLDCGILSQPDRDSLFQKALLLVGTSLEVFYLEDVISFVHSQKSGESFANEYLQFASLNRRPLQTPLDQICRILGNSLGIMGGRITCCSACAAGAQVVGEAFHRIRNGEFDLAIAGAADSMLNPLGLGGFSLLRALSLRNDDPTRACRPFDVDRDGTVLGEGSGFLILEEMNSALKRGAEIYGEIIGYASSLDAFRVSDPELDGKGAVLCMKKAIADAALSPEEIDCVNAHGTGTPKNDLVETSAIKEVLGSHAYKIPVHALKSMTGHLIAAGGAVEAVASAMALKEEKIPPTINLDNPDPLCDLDYVPGVVRPFHGKTILSNSFAFGGQNAGIIFRKL
ncbi:MAG: hypothetical protein HQM08_05960 [Candidatus Riflebacteria bacterium]|nr:hypothetical protein [Candidatus Riflebacteria bacterium]